VLENNTNHNSFLFRNIPALMLLNIFKQRENKIAGRENKKEEKIKRKS
jgi:hypothetical protein